MEGQTDPLPPEKTTLESTALLGLREVQNKF